MRFASYRLLAIVPFLLGLGAGISLRRLPFLLGHPAVLWQEVREPWVWGHVGAVLVLAGLWGLWYRTQLKVHGFRSLGASALVMPLAYPIGIMVGAIFVH